MNIILASASPRRIELLKKWGLKFDICPSSIDERTKLKRPSSIVKYLSYQKAKSIKEKYPESIVIGSDTIVVLNGEILGKPKNKKDSERIIRELNGSLHRVYTGVSILSDKKEIIFYDVAKVKMQKLSEEELKKLFGKHMDKAGSYAVQDKDDCFVKKIYGDYYTVVGLPYIKLKKELKKFKIFL
ncbi:MAG: septum formation protein Maf [Elusimicrobia bacterium]|nr:septum formation protein Maf [Elusimicrobiota bacterium]